MVSKKKSILITTHVIIYVFKTLQLRQIETDKLNLDI